VKKKLEKAKLAYKDLNFLISNEARPMRILSEYLEPAKRFTENNIRNTVVFFGSARANPKDKKSMGNYWAAEEMAFKLGNLSKDLKKKDLPFTVCTGGGPGIMEAANRGADRAGVKSIGLNIEIPFEQFPNQYISKELNFEFHYFFMRKLWFFCHAKAIIVFPGGFGTFDELFEMLTLLQTEKIERENFSILLFNKEYWDSVINFKSLVANGVISEKDLELFSYFSTVDEGFSFLKPRLIKSIKRNSNCI